MSLIGTFWEHMSAKLIYLPGAQLSWAQLSRGPTVRGPIVRGPTVRGPIVRGPKCLEPRKAVLIQQPRPERWIVTIPSSDQWLATIENHWKTIVSNGCQTTKPLKNHWYQWFSDQKPLENHCYQWFWRPKTIVKPLTSMVAFQPFI